jgi:acylphosphatase
MNNKHLNIQVTGRVQGVFFRASTQSEAQALGIKGFVRNEFDGSVYMEAEGPEGHLEKFIHWCRQGPPYAAVKNLKVTPGDMQNFREFLIRY